MAINFLSDQRNESLWQKRLRKMTRGLMMTAPAIIFLLVLLAGADFFSRQKFEQTAGRGKKAAEEIAVYHDRQELYDKVGGFKKRSGTIIEQRMRGNLYLDYLYQTASESAVNIKKLKLTAPQKIELTGTADSLLKLNEYVQGIFTASPSGRFNSAKITKITQTEDGIYEFNIEAVFSAPPV